MARKVDEAEVKKECPSCGLGVALDATMCEFCGWDFEEEDEWILQIEKLERDLMLEKQKFEPGTVNHKIQSTLHAPTLERTETTRLAAGSEAPATRLAPSREPGLIRGAKASEVKAQAVPVSEEVVEPVERKVRTVKAAPKSVVVSEAPAPAAKVRRVRMAKAAPVNEEAAEERPAEEQPKKTRVLRKMNR